jgi:cytochrome c oxidase assembly protein subunit 15
VATFPLLFVGGLVTSTGSALAVPDWPTTFGHNMFLYPWSQMVGGIFYEHSHRLLGALVGVLTIVLTGWLWFSESRSWLRWLGVVALVAVTLQGVLGGLRVVLLRETLAILHACLAQAFFALLAGIALLTSPRWLADADLSTTRHAGSLRRLCLVTTALIYAQIVVGAFVRHTGLWLDVHVALAIVVGLHVVLVAARIRRQLGGYPLVARPARLLVALLGLQLVFGVGSYGLEFTASGHTWAPALRVGVTTGHVAIGALMLITSLICTLQSARGGPTPRPAMSGRLLTGQVYS